MEAAKAQNWAVEPQGKKKYPNGRLIKKSVSHTVVCIFYSSTKQMFINV
jgi:hypothetical protein